MKKIAIVGHGYVGRALKSFFGEKFDITIYDPLQGFHDREAVNRADLAILSVPTPMSPTGEADLSALEETFAWIQTPLIVIKSTVPPGTTAQLAARFKREDSLVFSPEFIGEGGYPVPFWDGVPHPTDMKMHSFHIIGGKRTAVERVVPFFQKAAGPFASYHMTDSTTAELMKYMMNAWIATKVTFCNEFYDIAKTFGSSYSELRELWLLDGRVGESHTLVYPDKRGFDGKCIPKDTSAIYHAAKQHGYDSGFLQNILAVNAQRMNIKMNTPKSTQKKTPR